MNVNAIENGIRSILPTKITRRLATVALGAGLALATTSCEAKKDTYQKTTETTTEASTNKDKMKGEAIFGATLLAWMGAVALGNKLHDKKQ